MGIFMEKKYVFLDVDGTLVNFKSQIPDTAVEALKAAQKNGHKMIIATGRQKSQIYPWLLEKINFDGILASSGAYIELDGKVVFSSRPTKEKLNLVIDFFHRNNIPYCLQSANALYAEEKCYYEIVDFMRKRGSSESVIDSVLGGAVFTDNPKSLHNGGCCDIEKIAYYNSPLSLGEVRSELGDYYYVVGYSLGKEGSSYHGEITFDGLHKGTGVQKFMEAVGSSIENSIAIGDSGNDLEMIKCAGFGVAMGNASKDIKDAADLVTTDIDDDGIYNAFKSMGLIN